MYSKFVDCEIDKVFLDIEQFYFSRVNSNESFSKVRDYEIIRAAKSQLISLIKRAIMYRNMRRIGEWHAVEIKDL